MGFHASVKFEGICRGLFGGLERFLRAGHWGFVGFGGDACDSAVLVEGS